MSNKTGSDSRGWTGRMKRHAAFTLIELLVVVVIISMLLGMSTVGMENLLEQNQVKVSALKLQGFLLKARSMSISKNKQYGVIFNIECSGDGSIIDNLDNKHWYALIGPAQWSGGWTAYPYPNVYSTKDGLLYKEEVQKYQIGSRQYLEPETRFLALSDYEYNCGNDSQPPFRYPDPRYPKPWFGVWDPGQSTPYLPWGGRVEGDPASGFYYDSSRPSGKALVNGYCSDFVILFQPNGSIRAEDFWCRRTVYANSPSDEQWDRQYWEWWGSRCKYPKGMKHDSYFAGGVHITVAPDVSPGVTASSYQSEQDVIRSITPFYRVFVSFDTGMAEIRPTAHPACQINMNQKQDTTEWPPADGSGSRTAYLRNEPGVLPWANPH